MSKEAAEVKPLPGVVRVPQSSHGKYWKRNPTWEAMTFILRAASAVMLLLSAGAAQASVTLTSQSEWGPSASFETVAVDTTGASGFVVGVFSGEGSPSIVGGGRTVVPFGDIKPPAVPESGTFALMGLGLAALAVRVHKAKAR